MCLLRMYAIAYCGIGHSGHTEVLGVGISEAKLMHCILQVQSIRISRRRASVLLLCKMVLFRANANRLPALFNLGSTELVLSVCTTAQLSFNCLLVQIIACN